jgi:chromosome partitioning protein
MAIVIAVANQKGGCGKTTVAMNVAGALGRAGYRVLLVDADPQGSAMQWRNAREESGLPFAIQPYPYGTLHKELPRQLDGADYELVLIDCPPGGAVKGDSRFRADDITRSALLAAHLVLMPVRPTPLDYHAATTILPLLEDIAFYRQDQPLRAVLVINGKSPGRTRLGSEAKEVARELFTAQGLDIRVAETELCVRQAYAEAPSTGMTVTDYDPESKAAEEIRMLTEEVLACLSQNAAV